MATCLVAYNFPTTSGTFSQAMVQGLPADVVRQLTASLYLHFDMMKLPDAF